jgi:Cd2+/Zn2+-exporting ATPase
MTWLQNEKERRRILMLLSGLLIVGAWAAEWMAGWSSVRHLLLAVAALLAGGEIALRAYRSLRQRHVSIELLVTIAAGGALIIGETWEAAAVTFLFLLGAYLEARTMSRTRSALGALLAVAPRKAVVLREGEEVEVGPHQVAKGETVLVRPGALLPVDGIVSGGWSSVDESSITGESMPVEKEAGSKVFAGTVNQNGLLRVEATGVGADTTLARIIRRVEEAQEAKAPAQQFIERFARWYTPAIIALSAVAYLWTGDVRLALTLLVIGCPGALVISTPVSVVAGIGRAAQRGILIKGGQYLENAGKVSALALDKTGTLTEGKPRLTDVVVLAPQPVAVAAGAAPSVKLNGWRNEERSAAERDVLWWAAVAEAGSEHPLAQPIMQAQTQQAQAIHSEPLPEADDFEMVPGRGIRATYQGREIVVGNEAWLEANGALLDERAQQTMARLKEEGKTAVLVGLDGTAIGALGIADTLRESAATLRREVQAAGIKHVVMLTGDDPRTARAIAASAGIDEVHAGLLPEEKLAVIKELQAEGHTVAMVGDGINDAPALATADVGIAMGAAGTAVAIETADVALMSGDLHKIAEAMRLSRATVGNIRQNVVIALTTVAALLAGVLLGEVHMAAGMFVHELSVLVVILNGMRLLRA